VQNNREIFEKTTRKCYKQQQYPDDTKGTPGTLLGNLIIFPFSKCPFKEKRFHWLKQYEVLKHTTNYKGRAEMKKG